jgi:hypothetical protein
MDVAPGNYACGCYWVTAITTDSRYVEGTHAFLNNFYYLFIFPSSNNVEFAVEYNTGRVRARTYVNNRWNSWSSATPITEGGTGATTAAEARTNLGLGSAATQSHTTSVPSSGSSALITSGAVYNRIQELCQFIHVRNNATFTMTTKNTPYTVPLNTIYQQFNNGTFSLTNNCVNILKAGIYLISGQVNIKSSKDAANIIAKVIIGGNTEPIKITLRKNGTGSESLCLPSIPFQLSHNSATVELEVTEYSNDGSILDTNCILCVHRIG